MYNKAIFLLFSTFPLLLRLEFASARVSFNSFAADIFDVIALDRATENVVFSPLAIHFALGHLFFGTREDAAEELRQNLLLGNGSVIDVAEKFRDIRFQIIDDVREKGPEFIIANRIYINDRIHLNPRFNSIAPYFFGGYADRLHFEDKNATSDKINRWVAQEIYDKTTNVISPDEINPKNAFAVIVSGTNFRGEWEQPFRSTEKSNFYLSSGVSKTVDTLRISAYLRFAKLPHLGAQVIEIPYKNTYVALYLIVPDSVDGLETLESKLIDEDFNTIKDQMYEYSLHLEVPKFEISATIDLEDTLRELKISKIFESANFNGLIVDQPFLKIEKMKHHAIFGINEKGTGIVANKTIKLTSRSDADTVQVNRPFIYIVRCDEVVYFSGHVVDPTLGGENN